MAVRGSVVLFNSSLQFQNSFISAGSFDQTNYALSKSFAVAATGSSIGPAVQWYGGRSMLQVSSAQSYPFNLQFQQQMPDGSWIQVGSGILPTYITQPINQVVDLTFGLYRLVSSSGSTVALYGMISAVPYGV